MIERGERGESRDLPWHIGRQRHVGGFVVVQKVYEFRLWRPIELHSVAICSPCSNQPTQNRKEIHNVICIFEIPKLFAIFFFHKKILIMICRGIYILERTAGFK